MCSDHSQKAEKLPTHDTFCRDGHAGPTPHSFEGLLSTPTLPLYVMTLSTMAGRPEAPTRDLRVQENCCGPWRAAAQAWASRWMSKLRTPARRRLDDQPVRWGSARGVGASDAGSDSS